MGRRAAKLLLRWELRDARELLESMNMNESPPELRTVDPATVKVPMEHEIRALIAKLGAERRAADG